MKMMRGYYPQSQFELFPQETALPQEPELRGRFLPNITFTAENLMIGLVFVIMGMVLSFSLGVERGRKTTSNAGPVQPDAPAIVSVETVPALKSVAQAATAPETAPEKAAVPGGPAGLPSSAVQPIQAKRPAADDAQKIVDNIYTIQVASFKRQEQAERMAATLQKTGHEILVLPKGSYSIVCVGKFGERKEAQGFSTKLKKTYKDCLVRRL